MSNLTGQKIKNTYQSLLQISGSSTLADGTGSVVTSLNISASYATDANTALTAGSATSATTATSASYASNGGVTSLIAGDNISLSAGTGNITISAATSSAVAVDTGSLLTNASFSNPDITYTRGDGTTFTNTLTTLVPTSATSASYVAAANVDGTVATATSASHAVQADSAISATTATTATSASYATFAASVGSATSASAVNVTNNGSDVNSNYVTFVTANGYTTPHTDTSLQFVPSTNTLSTTNINATTFTGTLSGNASTATSASYASTASFVPEVVRSNQDTYTSSPAVQQIVTLTQAEYDAIPTPDSNTLYVISGSAPFDSTEFAQLATDNVFSGTTNTFNNIAVNGTASIGYVQTVTGSATIVGDSFIILNTSDATRYAGLVVEDSGSATPVNYTASFFFDSVLNDWNYEYTSGSTDYGVALFGPTYNTKGSPTYLTANTIPKAEGTHHLVDSSISDDGSIVSITGEVDVTGGVTSSLGFTGDLDGNATTATTAATASYVDGSAIVNLPLQLSGSNYIFVSGAKDNSTNGAELEAAYARAKTQTPGGSALSATNRMVIVVAPGAYSLGSDLAIDTSYVDITSLNGQRSVLIDSTSATLDVTADNVNLTGIDTTANTSKAFKITASNLSNLVVRNCKGGNGSFGTSQTISGTFIDCEAGDTSFAGNGGTASGTFIRCKCPGGNLAFGALFGTASGRFEECSCDINLSGYATTASGTWIRCEGSVSEFLRAGLNNSAGRVYHCIAGQNSFAVTGGSNLGKIYYTVMNTSTFPTVGSGGRYIACTDGNDNFIVQ